jgi:peptidoglycan hydrolase-like protein with peptidoglycan-binding domain
MNLQGRNLSVDVQGEDVRLLQSELRQLGFNVPASELQEAFFGPGTHEAVVRFKERLGLEPIDVVDAATATAINQAVDASIYTVAGTVVSPDRAGVGNLRVEIVDKNVGEDVPLEEAVTDERGRYHTRFSALPLWERGKTQPDLQARVLWTISFWAPPIFATTRPTTRH